MGIGRQSLYDTYGDKKSLFCRALNDYTESILGHFDAQISGAESPLAGIQHVVDGWDASQGGGDERGCMACNTLAAMGGEDEAITPLLSEHMSKVETLFHDALSAAKEKGELAQDVEPRKLSRTILTLAIGVAVLNRLPGTNGRVEDIVEVAQGLLGKESRDDSNGQVSVEV